MKIVDNGDLVEYWFKAGSSSNSWNGLQFQIIVNGVTVNKTVDYSTGANWLKLYSSTVSYTQTVTFKLLTATGTTGMGGPTTFTQVISRVPTPSGTPTVTNPTVSTLDVAWAPPDVGPVTGYQVGYSSNGYATSPDVLVDVVSSPHTMANLPTGTTLWFWTRAKNGVGWGSWSGRTVGSTYMGAYVNVNGAWKISTPYVKVAGVWKMATALFPETITGGPITPH
jgi:hypothetical protein